MEALFVSDPIFPSLNPLFPPFPIIRASNLSTSSIVPKRLVPEVVVRISGDRYSVFHWLIPVGLSLAHSCHRDVFHSFDLLQFATISLKPFIVVGSDS